MSFNFLYKPEILGKQYSVKEISFYEYKNVVKSIIETDALIVSEVFENFLKFLCPNLNNVTNLEKFLLLIKVRTLILGRNVEFVSNDVKIVYDVNNVFNFFNKKFPLFEYTFGNNNFKLSLPTTMLPKSDNIFDLVLDCIYSINDEVIQKDEKLEIINKLPALPIVDIYTKLIQYYNSVSIKIQHLDYTLTPFNDSFLSFTRSIYMYDLKNLYDLEYSLRRNLNLTSQDFNSLSLPECEIFLKNYQKEIETFNNQAAKVE